MDWDKFETDLAVKAIAGFGFAVLTWSKRLRATAWAWLTSPIGKYGIAAALGIGVGLGFGPAVEFLNQGGGAKSVETGKPVIDGEVNAGANQPEQEHLAEEGKPSGGDVAKKQSGHALTPPEIPGYVWKVEATKPHTDTRTVFNIAPGMDVCSKCKCIYTKENGQTWKWTAVKEEPAPVPPIYPGD